jgi:hypothetical protein
VRLTVSALGAAPIIRFARAVAVFIMAVIVIAVRLVVITAMAADATRQVVVGPLVAVVIRFLMGAALASVMRVVIIVPARAIAPVIVAVCHLATSKS